MKLAYMMSGLLLEKIAATVSRVKIKFKEKTQGFFPVLKVQKYSWGS